MTRHAFAVMYSAESDMTVGWNQKRKCVVRGAKGKVVSRPSLSAASNRIVVGPSVIGGEELQKQGCTSHLPVSWLHPGIGLCVFDRGW